MFLVSAVLLMSKVNCRRSWCIKLLKFLMSAVIMVSIVVEVPDVCKCSWCLKLLMFLMSAVFLMSKVVDVPDVCSAPGVQS